MTQRRPNYESDCELDAAIRGAVSAAEDLSRTLTESTMHIEIQPVSLERRKNDTLEDILGRCEAHVTDIENLFT